MELKIPLLKHKVFISCFEHSMALKWIAILIIGRKCHKLKSMFLFSFSIFIELIKKSISLLCKWNLNLLHLNALKSHLVISINGALFICYRQTFPSIFSIECIEKLSFWNSIEFLMEEFIRKHTFEHAFGCLCIHNIHSIIYYCSQSTKCCIETEFRSKNLFCITLGDKIMLVSDRKRLHFISSLSQYWRWLSTICVGEKAPSLSLALAGRSLWHEQMFYSIFSRNLNVHNSDSLTLTVGQS